MSQARLRLCSRHTAVTLASTRSFSKHTRPTDPGPHRQKAMAHTKRSHNPPSRTVCPPVLEVKPCLATSGDAGSPPQVLRLTHSPCCACPAAQCGKEKLFSFAIPPLASSFGDPRMLRWNGKLPALSPPAIAQVRPLDAELALGRIGLLLVCIGFSACFWCSGLACNSSCEESDKSTTRAAP